MTKGSMTLREQEEILESFSWDQPDEHTSEVEVGQGIQELYAENDDEAAEFVDAHQVGLRKLLKLLVETTDG